MQATTHREEIARGIMFRVRYFAAMLVFSMLGFSLTIPNMAYAAPCAVPADQTSLQVRMLQTELMVAALTCNQRPKYNAFVTRFQPELAAQGKHLQTFFKKQYGSTSAKALNGFITRIANESSRRGMLKRGAFCRQADSIHAETAKITPAALPAFAKSQSFSSGHGISPCLAKVAAKEATE